MVREETGSVARAQSLSRCPGNRFDWSDRSLFALANTWRTTGFGPERFPPAIPVRDLRACTVCGISAGANITRDASSRAGIRPMVLKNLSHCGKETPELATRPKGQPWRGVRSSIRAGRYVVGRKYLNRPRMSEPPAGMSRSVSPFPIFPGGLPVFLPRLHCPPFLSFSTEAFVRG